MIRLILLPVFIFFGVMSLAQAPHIQWQKCYGGSNDDIAEYIVQTSDSGYIIAGSSRSHDHDVSVNYGANDVWIVRTNQAGTILWQRTYGGSADDRANYIQQTADGGFIVGCISKSADTDVAGNYGDFDYWVMKLDATGGITWQQNYGGSDDDELHCIRQTHDGGYILAGHTRSNDHDVSGNHGDFDIWIVKLSATGSIMWQKTLGGSGGDFAGGIWENRDSSLYVLGNTDSIDGDVSGNHGFDDIWVTKLTSAGSLVWQKCYGGTSTEFVIDDFGSADLQQTFDNGIIISGWTSSTDGDITGNHGFQDYWVAKLDDTGRIEWSHCFGGSLPDYSACIQQTADSGYVVTGSTASNDDDVSHNRGRYDYWTIKLSPAGILQWQQCLGGSGPLDGEVASAVHQTFDHGYIVAGATNSNDSDVSGNHGGYDFWIVKLFNETTLSEPTLPDQAISITPNPVADRLSIKGGQEPDHIVLYNLAGQQVLIASHTRDISVASLAPGMYFISIFSEGLLLKREKIVKL